MSAKGSSKAADPRASGRLKAKGKTSAGRVVDDTTRSVSFLLDAAGHTLLIDLALAVGAQSTSRLARE